MAFGLGRAGGATVRLAVDDAQFNRDLVRDSSNFRRTTGNMEHDLSRLSRGALAGTGVFHGFARSIAFASSAFLGGAGLTAVIRDSISAASDLHEEINKTAVVFRGGAAPAVEAFAKTAATSFGISETAALSMAATFGNMLVPMGFARRDAAGMSVELVKLASDMASFNNADPTEVLQALQSALAGQVRPLRQYGVALSAARIQHELVSAGIHETAQQITAAQRAWAIYRIVFKDTADAQGDFARTSGGLANQQRILRAQIDDTEAKIGQALLPTVLNITSGLNDWLSSSENQAKVQKEVNSAVEHGKQVFDAIEHTVEALAPVTETLTKAVGGLQNAFELIFAVGIATKLRGLGLSLAGGKGSIARQATVATEEVGILSGALASLATLGLITIGIELLIHRKWVGDKVDEALQSIFGVGKDGTTGGPPGATAGVTRDAVKDMARRGLNAREIQARLKKQYGISLTLAQIRSITGDTGVARGAIEVPRTLRDALTLTSGGDPGELLQGAHHTEGFPGSAREAVDIAAKAGTPVLAPENGRITRISGNAPATSGSHNINGYNCYFVGDSGSRYYITHLAQVSPKGHYRRGQVIATVADHTQGGDHFHVDYDPPINFVNASSSARGTPGLGGLGGTPPPGNTDTTAKADKTGAGTSLVLGTGTTYKGERLDDEQKNNAEMIYDLATQRGLTPDQALQLVAVAYAESGLRTNAINKKSGAFGLFQLLSPGYVKRYNQLRRKGYSPAVANFLAIFPDYQAYFKKHPHAAPGQAGAAVERSGAGADFYAKGIGSTFQLGKAGAGGSKAKGPPDPISDKLYTELQGAEISGNLQLEDKILTNIITILNRAIAKAKTAKRRRELLDELMGFLSKRKDVRAQIAEGFTKSLETAVGQISAGITAATKGPFSVEDVIDQATGKVTGRDFADITTVRMDPATHKWIVVKVKPTLDAAKKELDYIMSVVLPGIQKRIDALSTKLKAYAKHPKANARLIADAKNRRAALIKERDDIVAMAQDLAQWIADMEAALSVPPDKEDTSGGGTADTAAASPTDFTAIPSELRLAGALAADTPGFADDIGYLRSVDALYTQRLASNLSPEDRIAVLGARQANRQALASAATSVDLNLQLGQAQARLTPSPLDDRAILQKIETITEARLKEARTIEEQIALTNQLADLKSQLNDMQGQENSQLIAYLNARRELARTFTSNVLSPALSGAQITIQNFNQPTPDDPHLWSVQTKFELQALVS